MSRVDLDQAIDRVAKRLTHVGDDPHFSERVVTALPGQATWFGWLTQSWAPRLAMVAIVAGTAAFWNARHVTEVTPAQPPLASVAYVDWSQLVGAAVAREPLALVRTMPLERLEPLEPLARLDHERSLPSIEAPSAVEIAALSAGDLPAESALSLAPIVITDLPLTAESFPQRD